MGQEAGQRWASSPAQLGSPPPEGRAGARRRGGGAPAGKVCGLPLLLLQLLFGHHLPVLVPPQLPRTVFKGEDLSPCREETGQSPRRPGAQGASHRLGSSFPFAGSKGWLPGPILSCIHPMPAGLPGLRSLRPFSSHTL